LIIKKIPTENDPEKAEDNKIQCFFLLLEYFQKKFFLFIPIIKETYVEKRDLIEEVSLVYSRVI